MLLKIARIGKPHGIKGESTVELFTDSPKERFAAGKHLLAFDSDKEAKENPKNGRDMIIESAREHQGKLLVVFKGQNTRNDAENMRNKVLYQEDDELNNRDGLERKDSWYEHELLGFEVFLKALENSSEKSSEKIGVVSALQVMPGQDLLVIKTDKNGEEVYVPFVKEIVPDIDEKKKKIIVDPPSGLFDI